MSNTRRIKQPLKPEQAKAPPSRVDLPDELRQEGLALHIAVKRAEQLYMDWVKTQVDAFKIGEGFQGKGQINYDPLLGLFRIERVA